MPEECDICKHAGQKLQEEKGKRIFPVSADEEYILSFFYTFKVRKICMVHKLNIFKNKHKKCCDPFNHHQKKPRVSKLKTLDVDFVKEAHQYLPAKDVSILVPLKKLCQDCFKEVEQKVSDIKEKQLMETDTPGCSQQSEGSNFSDLPSSGQAEDGNLEETANDPLYIQLKRLRKREEQLQDEVETLKEKAEEYDELVQNIKTALPNQQLSTKLTLVNVLPKSWTKDKLKTELQVSRRLVDKAAQLKTTGVVPERKVRSDKVSEEEVEAVENFYLRRDISRELPGAKDYRSVKVNGERKRLRKHLLLSTLDEAYTKFKEENEDIKIGLTKFQELRPPQIVLAGASGTHNVCVCIHHKNPDLRISSSVMGQNPVFKNELLKRNPDRSLTAVSLVHEIVCEEENTDCWLGDGELCEDCDCLVEELKERFLRICESLSIVEIEFDQWVATDYSTLFTVQEPVELFANNFARALQELKAHHFLSVKQEKNYNSQLKNLQPGHLLIIMDFAENYTFKTQNSVQSSYYINKQCTLHPVVIYTNEDRSESPKPHSYVVISDSLDHSAGTVSCFYKRLFSDIIRTTFPFVKHIQLWTDGAPTQVIVGKNLLMTNLIIAYCFSTKT